jgi:putative ATP-dependent endonuclease of OLD family
MAHISNGDVSIGITNYKAFGEPCQGFDEIAPLNLIVGRNNSGKSALIDLIEFVCNAKEATPSRVGKVAEITITIPFVENYIDQLYPIATKPAEPANLHDPAVHQKYQQLLAQHESITAAREQVIGHANKLLTYALRDGRLNRMVDFSEDFPPHLETKLNNASASDLCSLVGKKFFRLDADRDVRPEHDQDSLYINSNGQGLTNTVQRILNQATLPHHLIDENFLEGLNTIFSPDANFTDIDIRVDNNLWEIYLREKHKGLVPLSKSGSGLKTVLLVLASLIVLPYIHKTSASDFVFCFEELENNLHPALQRRLIAFIRQKALEYGCVVFFTTHSSAVIDMLGKDEKAQILHVTHGGMDAKVQRVTSYVESKGVLDDLDVRASDLLQANGVVWVEGPSDRLYFNRWIELISNGSLQEGAHYQCVFYGGRLLAHLSGETQFESDAAENAIKIFGINRNAIAIMDSDLKVGGAKLGDTKLRIIAEMDTHDSMAWVTQGKEIENYLSSNVLNTLYPGLTASSQNSDFADHLALHDSDIGKRYERKKVQFAERVTEIMTSVDLNVLDLHEKVSEAAARIAKWNGLVLPPLV